MFVTYAVVAIALAAALIGSAYAKLTRKEQIVQSITGLGVPLSWFSFLAACEIAGGVGLVVGLAVAWIGVAAAVGVSLYFVGAVAAHIRAGDVKGLGAPVPLLVIAVLAVILRILSA